MNELLFFFALSIFNAGTLEEVQVYHYKDKAACVHMVDFISKIAERLNQKNREEGVSTVWEVDEQCQKKQKA